MIWNIYNPKPKHKIVNKSPSVVVGGVGGWVGGGVGGCVGGSVLTGTVGVCCVVLVVVGGGIVGVFDTFGCVAGFVENVFVEPIKLQQQNKYWFNISSFMFYKLFY